MNEEAMIFKEFFIRIANYDDLVQIMNIVPHVIAAMNACGNLQWSEIYPLENNFKDDIDKNELWVAVLISTSEVVGFAALTTDQPPEYAEVGWDLRETVIVPHRLAVSPCHQKKGIAKALMNKAEDLAKQKGYSCVRVDTCSRNVNARKLIEKCGYNYVGELMNGFPLARDMTFLCFEKIIK
eukprot:gene5605-11318_t